MALRLVGKVGRVDVRTGSKNGNNWRMTTVKVQTADVDVVEVLLSRDMREPQRGEGIDYAIAVEIRPGWQGGPPSVQCVAFATWAEATGELPLGDTPDSARGLHSAPAPAAASK
jgi:hypothetical protein